MRLECVDSEVCLAKSQVFQSVAPQEEIMPTIEARLRQQLRDYAVELRRLTYTLPNGVGEHDLLRLSERMRAAADVVVCKGA
jgi:hypothetical protein